MRMGFYPRLAWDGIRKNRRLYTPYLLACTGVVMMHYIIGFLAASPIVAALPGGSTIAGVRALEQHGFRGAVMDCVAAAYEKNQKLGK